MKTVESRSINKWVVVGIALMIFSFSCNEKKKKYQKVNDCNDCPTYQGAKPAPPRLNSKDENEVVAVKEVKATRSAPTKKLADKDEIALPEVVLIEENEEMAQEAISFDMASGTGAADMKRIKSKTEAEKGYYMVEMDDEVERNDWNTESYDVIHENQFLASTENPLSTFSIDVDNASYTNTRRFLNNGSLPPKDAVRIEEFVNYFAYDYKQPKGEHPFSINTEIGKAPWNEEHRLVHIGLQGKKIPFDEIEPLNLVFLLDVSGSMSDHNKLPLLKKSLELLVDKMRPQDRVAITVYAGAAGLVLPSTPGSDKKTILKALDRLEAGGSTAGGEGIKLAYKVATENFRENGVNRVILATDGDFNIGASSNAEMTRLIEEKRESGVFLTVLGFGMGNYKDSRMETIADNGNGNYFYIDNIQESNKVLADELGSTLYTIAKDVKLQVEFNPQKVQAYRLIGYENRMLEKEDFNNDKKDAGELGAGHTVTAIYEVIPVGVKSSFVQSVDELKYQTPVKNSTGNYGDELLTVKFRYKEPNGTKSKLIVHPLKDRNEENNSDNFQFSAAVAGWGMLLRDSEFKQNLNYPMVLELAQAGKGQDVNGHRGEFVKLVKTAELLDRVSTQK